MPPKVKITKEEITAAALELLRQRGMDAINARAVAKELGCSTQPIFSNYSTMTELFADVLAAAYTEYSQWTGQQMKMGWYPPYKASGMAYISFARQQSELFRVLFMRDRREETPQAEDDFTRSIIAVLMEKSGLNEQDARMLHLEMWIFVHGVASMLVTGYLDLDEEIVSKMLTEQYFGLLQRKKENAK